MLVFEQIPNCPIFGWLVIIFGWSLSYSKKHQILENRYNTRPLAQSLVPSIPIILPPPSHHPLIFTFLLPRPLTLFLTPIETWHALYFLQPSWHSHQRLALCKATTFTEGSVIHNRAYLQDMTGHVRTWQKTNKKQVRNPCVYSRPGDRVWPCDWGCVQHSHYPTGSKHYTLASYWLS